MPKNSTSSLASLRAAMGSGSRENGSPKRETVFVSLSMESSRWSASSSVWTTRMRLNSLAISRLSSRVICRLPLRGGGMRLATYSASYS